MTAPHDAAIQAQRDVLPMSDAKLAEIRRYLTGRYGREAVAEIDRLKKELWRASDAARAELLASQIADDAETWCIPTQWCTRCDGLFDNPDDANWHTEALGHLTTSDPAKAWQPTREICR